MPRIPTSLKIAQGDARKIGMNKLREKYASEPQGPRGLPSCPGHLKGRAREAWGFLVAKLEQMDIDRQADALMLEGAAVNYARAVEADILIARDGAVVEESVIDEESGERVVLKRKTHPAVAISKESWRLAKVFLSEFGLSPASLSRVSVDPGGKGEDLAEILSRPRPARNSSIQ